MPGHRMSSSVMKDLIRLLGSVSRNINPTLRRTYYCTSNFSSAESANNRCIMSDCSLSYGARAT
jgi:hypothetical protein